LLDKRVILDYQDLDSLAVLVLRVRKEMMDFQVLMGNPA